jgi:hypothetical protein
LGAEKMVMTEGKLRLGVLRYMVYLISMVFEFHKMGMEEEKEKE